MNTSNDVLNQNTLNTLHNPTPSLVHVQRLLSNEKLMLFLSVYILG